MIKIVEGDLLQATEDIIGHQVNCQGKMNSGVAKSIREKFPLVYKMYMKRCNFYVMEMGYDTSRMLGMNQVIQVEEGKWVANLFGQNFYGYDGLKYTNEKSLFETFKKLREYAESQNLSVALPYLIGCDRGGGDWKTVEGYLSKAFDGYEVTLYKYNEDK